VKNQQGLRGARHLIIGQMGVTLLMTAIAALVSGRVAALSTLLGGLVSLVPNALFAINVFKYQGARAAKQIVNSFYKGEALKIVLSVIMFSLVFILFNIKPLVFFAAYIMVQMVIWFSPLIFVNKQNRPKSD